MIIATGEKAVFRASCKSFYRLKIPFEFRDFLVIFSVYSDDVTSFIADCKEIPAIRRKHCRAFDVS